MASLLDNESKLMSVQNYERAMAELQQRFNIVSVSPMKGPYMDETRVIVKMQKTVDITEVNDALKKYGGSLGNHHASKTNKDSYLVKIKNQRATDYAFWSRVLLKLSLVGFGISVLALIVVKNV